MGLVVGWAQVVAVEVGRLVLSWMVVVVVAVVLPVVGLVWDTGAPRHQLHEMPWRRMNPLLVVVVRRMGDDFLSLEILEMSDPTKVRG